MSLGMMVMTSGIETDSGVTIEKIDSNNWNIDSNYSHYTVDNSTPVWVLANLMLYGGIAFILFTFGLLMRSGDEGF